MKKIILLVALLVSHTIVVNAEEKITQFTSQVRINKDTTVSIQENITYETDVEHQGIYRYIPYRYKVNGLGYSTQVELDSVTDLSGQPYQVKTEKENGNVSWRIGTAGEYFTGTKNYLITYTVSDILRQFDGYDELYIDITGEGWNFPIESTQTTISSPFAKIIDVRCYTSDYGSQAQECQVNIVSDQEISVTTSQSISYGDNLTVVVKLDPNNQLIFPSQTEKLLKWLTDNFWLLLVPVPLLSMLWLWYTKGRDQTFLSPNIFDMSAKPTKLRPVFGHERTPMVYQPLTQLTPGEAGAIIDENVDNRDIVAEIIDLARKKYLKIAPLTTGKFIFKSKDFVFTKLQEPDDQLPKHQKYLLEKIFKSGDEVKMSKLKGKFYTTMNKVRKMIYDSAHEKKLFTTAPSNVMVKYGFIISIITLGVAIIATIISRLDSPLPLFLTGSQFFIVPFFVKAMVQKSAVGYNYYMQSKGLRQTIKVGAWREKIHERRLFFDEVLPFAISFDVVDKLAKDMEDLSVEAPSYLAASGWSTHAFSQSLNNFGSQATKSLSYNPSSSSASGGSGFSSGGGFSGGGFSGGGGGSW